MLRASSYEEEFPNVKFVDCDTLGLALYDRCMRIFFKESGTTEYAGLSYFYGEESVLEGQLYDSELNMKQRSGMSLDIGDDGNNCSVSLTIRHMQGTCHLHPVKDTVQAACCPAKMVPIIRQSLLSNYPYHFDQPRIITINRLNHYRLSHEAD